jgi:hypothetical protein
MSLLPKQSLLRKTLPIIFDVLSSLGNFRRNLISPRNKQTINQVLRTSNVGFSTLDILLQLDHPGSVLMSPHLEIKFDDLEAFIQVVYLGTIQRNLLLIPR